jgi:hypothetical protein
VHKFNAAFNAAAQIEGKNSRAGVSSYNYYI